MRETKSGSGPFGLRTIRDVFEGEDKSIVMLIFDVWESSGSTRRTQVRLPYMKIEDVVEKYGDFIYDGWYTEGFDGERIKASLWACADKDRRVDPWLYNHWPELWNEK